MTLAEIEQHVAEDRKIYAEGFSGEFSAFVARANTDRDWLLAEVRRLTGIVERKNKKILEESAKSFHICEKCDALAAKLAESKRDVESLNAMIREYGFGQGEINGWATEHQELTAKLAAAQAALREQVQYCRECGGTGEVRGVVELSGQFCSGHLPCPICKPARDLLREQGAES